MEGPTLNFGDFVKSFDKCGHEGIIKSGVGAERSVDIAAHGVYISFNSEKSGVVGSTRDLLNKNREGERLGRREILVVMLLANTGLSVFVEAHEEEFVNIHFVNI